MKWISKRFANYIKNISTLFADNADGMAKSRSTILLSNCLSAIISNLSGGYFLTGLLLIMKADNNFIGMLSIVTLTCGFAQLISPLILERIQKRKTLLISGRLIFHILNVGVLSIIPFIPFENSAKLNLFLLITILAYIVNALTMPGTAIWHIKNVPNSKQANMFSLINIVNAVITYIIMVLASRLVDVFKSGGSELAGITIIRVLSLILAAGEIFLFTKIKEHTNENTGESVNIRNILIRPWKEHSYLKTTAIVFIWTFANNIPGPYLSIYLLKDVKLSYTFINTANLLYIPILLIMTPLWASAINRMGKIKTLYLSMLFYLIGVAAFPFITAKTSFIFPIALVASFIFSPAINIIFALLPYSNMPKTDQTNYISFYQTMVNAAAILGIFVGRQFIKITDGVNINFLGMQMQNKQYLIFLQVIGILFCIIYTYKINTREHMQL